VCKCVNVCISALNVCVCVCKCVNVCISALKSSYVTLLVEADMISDNGDPTWDYLLPLAVSHCLVTVTENVQGLVNEREGVHLFQTNHGRPSQQTQPDAPALNHVQSTRRMSLTTPRPSNKGLTFLLDPGLEGFPCPSHPPRPALLCET